MKTLKFLSTVMLAIFFAITIISCNDDDDKPTEKEQSEELLEASEAIQEKMERVSLPESLENHPNEYAQLTSTQFYTVKAYSTYILGLFNVIPPNPETVQASTNLKAKGVTASADVTYKWSSAGTTVYYTINELADRYTVKWRIESPEENHVVFDGYFLKDESYAEFNIYGAENSPALNFKWWFSEDTTKMEFLDTLENYKITLESNNHNYSGTLKAYENNIIEAEALWNADGSGWYKDYATGKTHSWSAQ